MDKYLPEFVHAFYNLPLIHDHETIERMCADFILNWDKVHQNDPSIDKTLAYLSDSVELFDTIREFALTFTSAHITLLKEGKALSSLTMICSYDPCKSYASGT